MDSPDYSKDRFPVRCKQVTIESTCGTDDCDEGGFSTLNFGGRGNAGSNRDEGETSFRPPPVNPPPIPAQISIIIGGVGDSPPRDGEEEASDCENSVGSGPCCFNTDIQNCCYVTCYKKIYSPSEEEPECCPEGELVGSPPVCLNDDGTWSGVACNDPANVGSGNMDLCAITKEYCFTGTNDSGNMVFSAGDGSGSVSFNPNTGQFTPPSGGDENEIDALPCESTGYESFESFCGCLLYGCACRKTGDEVEEDGGDLVDGVMYVECEHGDLYVGIDEDVPDLGEVPDPSGESSAVFLNSTNICDDPDGQCTSYKFVRFCVVGCPDPQYVIKKVPGCSVSWRPPSDEEPPEFEWGGSDDGDYGRLKWTPGGSQGGAPSSDCGCDG